jgi:D-3-phosphoglycerate dehydrogenase
VGLQQILDLKVLHLEIDQYSEPSRLDLQERTNLVAFQCSSQQALYNHLEHNQYDVIFTRLGLMLDEKCLAMQQGLQYIVTPTTGLNHIDLEKAEERNIAILSLKGETEFLNSIKSTAEHTWSLMLALARNLNAAISDTKNGSWNRLPFLADELNGKNLGIIGYGRLGKIIAKYAQAFGMDVMAYDNREDAFSSTPVASPTPLDTLLERSDFIVLLISYSNANEKFMDAGKFNKMKKTAYFINTSRGELVDESALLEALSSNSIKGAALDVLNNDSAWDGKIQGSYPLLEHAKQHNNLLITPHMGGFGKESIARTRDFVTQKLLKAIVAN